MLCARAALVQSLSATRRAAAPRSAARVRCASGADDARARLQRSFDAPTVMPRAETNVLGEPLELCCAAPKTGFYRDGYCVTGSQVRERFS